jgi:DNA-binding transcriptional MerR regulator/methylmalonyl-CoA mutase cobalamin-binding subunit
MYTIKQAAARSGVNVALLRAWERRYHVVEPTRTDAGYRLYDDDAIARLRAMRSLVEAGWSPRQAAAHLEEASADELRALSTVDTTTANGASPENLVDAFVEAAAKLDAVAVERSLDEMFASGTFERVAEDHLFPALRALGNAWGAGEVDVAGEHAASAAVLRRLSMAFEAAGTGRSDEAPVVVGLPPGARHEIGALAFATAARRAGVSVIYLGADVPVPSWVAAVSTAGARAVAFGTLLETDVPAANQVVTALRAAVPDVVVAVGGRRSAEVGNGGVLRLSPRITDAVEELRAALG